MTRRAIFLPFVMALVAAILSIFHGSGAHTLAAPRISEVQYVVRPGDTLWGIAEKHRTSVARLIHGNSLSSDVLYINQRLWVDERNQQHAPSKKAASNGNSHRAVSQHSAKPFRAFRTVAPGDTLWQLAITYHASVQHLMQINGLNSDMIVTGQKLCIFSGSKSTWDTQQMALVKKMGVPLDLVAVYKGAGKKYGVPWTVLAAIHHQETHYSTNGYEVSPDGAEGPMQFMPSTFAVYGVTAPGQTGAPNIHNVYDAIYSCANMLAADGYSRSPTTAIYQYNHSIDYVVAVQSYAENV